MFLLCKKETKHLMKAPLEGIELKLIEFWIFVFLIYKPRNRNTDYYLFSSY